MSAVAEASTDQVVATWLETNRPTGFAIRWPNVKGDPSQLLGQDLETHAARASDSPGAVVLFTNANKPNKWSQVPADVVNAAAAAEKAKREAADRSRNGH
jgi:hypothetical protein